MTTHISTNICYSQIHAIKHNLISFRSHGINKIEYAPLNDSQIMAVNDINERILLLYYHGFLHRKKENEVIRVHEILEMYIDIKSNIIDNIMIFDFAMICGDMHTCDWLISIGLDFDDYDKTDMVVLSIASNNVNMIRWVADKDIELGEWLDENLIIFAIRCSCCYDVINYLVMYGIEIVSCVNLIELKYENRIERKQIIDLLKQ